MRCFFENYFSKLALSGVVCWRVKSSFLVFWSSGFLTSAARALGSEAGFRPGRRITFCPRQKVTKKRVCRRLSGGTRSVPSSLCSDSRRRSEGLPQGCATLARARGGFGAVLVEKSFAGFLFMSQMWGWPLCSKGVTLLLLQKALLVRVLRGL